jgi:hypothetical protein
MLSGAVIVGSFFVGFAEARSAMGRMALAAAVAANTVRRSGNELVMKSPGRNTRSTMHPERDERESLDTPAGAGLRNICGQTLLIGIPMFGGLRETNRLRQLEALFTVW